MFTKLVIIILVSTLIYACEENWTCTNWSNCSNNYKTRICNESNQCNTTEFEPIQLKVCKEYEILLPIEPYTCGNGKIDEGESFLNCNKDVEVRLLHYVNCLDLGENHCVYYNIYKKTVFVILGFIGISTILLIKVNRKVVKYD